MANSIKQQLAADLKKVKTQSGDRVQQIKTIVKTAFIETLAEVKDGTQEVKATSKESLDNLIQTVAPQDAAEAVVTVTATENHPVIVLPLDSDAPESSESDSKTQPKLKVEHSKRSLLQALFKAAGLKGKSLADAQYDKLKEELPQRLEQIKDKTHVWDEQLSDRYGDHYSGIKQRWTKAVAWYQAKLEEGKAINIQPLERKQAQNAEAFSDLGVKVAQKEEAVKQQIGQTLRTITVNTQS